MSARWFRFYADAMRHPKVARLTDAQFRLWVELLSVAAENDGHIPPADDLKHMLKKRLDHLLRGLDDLIRASLIDPLDAGYEPHGWAKRQYKSDTSTVRVRKHREKGNVSVTPPDTETDTEKEKKPPTPLEGERPKPTRRRASVATSPLPEDWSPGPFSVGTQSRVIVEGWLPQTMAEQLEAFRAHHVAKGNQQADWQSAWSTWVLNTRRFRTVPENQQEGVWI